MFLGRPRSGHALSLAFLALGACASPSRYLPGIPCEITFRDYRSGVTMSLINETKSSRKEFYSQPSRSIATKVISDSLMETLVERFEGEGFFGSATAGALPNVPTAPAAYGLAVQVDRASSHLLRTAASSQPDAAAMGRMFAEFRKVYDGTFQAQSVPAKGRDIFRGKP